MGEFEIKVPIKEQVTGAAGVSGGDKELIKSVKKLDKSIIGTLDVWEILTQFIGDVVKLLSPLIKILSLLMFVIFLPMLPAIKGLVQIIAQLIPAVMAFHKNVQSGLTQFFQDIWDGFKKGWEVFEFLWETIKAAGEFIWKQFVSIGEQFILGGEIVLSTILALGEIFTFAGLWIWESVQVGFGFLATVGEWIWDFILGALNAIADLGTRIWEWVKGALSSISNLGERIWDWIKGALSSIGSFFGGERAAGGSVSAGQSYLVGEKGPELFMPNGGGTIIPNGSLGGGITINVTGNSFRGEQDIKKMVDMISRELQKRGARSSAL